MFWHLMFLFLTLSISNMKARDLLLQSIFSSYLFLSTSELEHAHSMNGGVLLRTIAQSRFRAIS